MKIIEVVMKDGSTVKIKAPYYEIDGKNRILRIKEYNKKVGEYSNAFFNLDFVAYAGTSEILHSGEGEDD